MPKDEVTPALLMPLLRWDVLEDRTTLERASIADATKRFITWRDATCVERDGDGADHALVRAGSVARFQFFVMVDDESLRSFQEADGNMSGRAKGRRPPPVKVRVVDAGKPWIIEALNTLNMSVDEESDEDVDEGGSLDNEDVPVDGCTDWDVGWMWVEAKFLLGFYDTLQADSGWDHFYTRPPKVYGRS